MSCPTPRPDFVARRKGYTVGDPDTSALLTNVRKLPVDASEMNNVMIAVRFASVNHPAVSIPLRYEPTGNDT